MRRAFILLLTLQVAHQSIHLFQSHFLPFFARLPSSYMHIYYISSLNQINIRVFLSAREIWIWPPVGYIFGLHPSGEIG